MRRRLLLAASGTFLAGGLISWFAIQEFVQHILLAHYRVRYKLTAGVRLDGQLFSGSSVIEVQHSQPAWHNPSTAERLLFYETKTYAEAAVIDLKERGLLFALIGAPQFHSAFWAKRPDDYLPTFLNPGLRERALADSNWGWEQYEKLQGVFVLPQERQPALVRFADINDPTSAQLVTVENISSIYGPNAKIEPATIVLPSAEPLTTGIEKVLPWYRKGGLYRDRDTPQEDDKDISNELTGEVFKIANLD